MEAIEDKLYRLIDQRQFIELEEIIKENPQMETLVRDVIYIKNGLEASRVDLLTQKLQDYETELCAVEDVLIKSSKMNQVSSLTKTLKSFEEENFNQIEGPKSKVKTIILKPWYKYVAAASIIFVLSIGLVINLNSSFDMDQYYIESSSMSTRSDAQSSNIIRLAESKNWKALISSSNSESLTMLENYHVGIAYMHTGEHLKSVEYLEQVIESRLPEYEELAVYHKMINLYLLDDKRFLDIQSAFLQNPESRFYHNSKKLSE